MNVIQRKSLLRAVLVLGLLAGLHLSLPAISYSGSSVSHPALTTAYQGDVDLEVLEIRIDMVNGGGPKSLQSLNLSTNGSTNAVGDLLNARVYFTGASPAFATTNAFGAPVAGPSGAFSVTGTQALSNGANYFWLVYDIRPNATIGNQVDGECLSFDISGTNFSPPVPAPAGSRPIDVAKTTWQLALGTAGNEFANDLVQTPDGGYILAGNGYNFGAGNNDLYLVRIDAQGNILWANAYGNPGDEWPESIIRLSDGNYGIVGRTSSFGGGDYDLMAMKIDLNGNVIWQHSYGGAGYEVGWALAEMHDGSLVFVGQTDGFGSGNLDGYLIYTDPGGAMLWSRTLGTNLGIDALYSVMESSDSLIVVAGSGRDATNDTDAMVAKFDRSGNVVWATLLGGLGNEVGWDIKEQTDARFLLSGFTTTFGAGGADALVVRLNPLNGAVLRATTYGGTGTDYGSDMELTDDGGAAFTGHTNSAGAGGSDYFLTKIDSSGNLEWSWTYGSTSMETPHGLVYNTDRTFSIIGETFGFGIPSDIYMVRTAPDGLSQCNEFPSGFVRNTVALTQSFPLLSGSGGAEFSNSPQRSAISSTASVQCLNVVLDAAGVQLNGNIQGERAILSWEVDTEAEPIALILERSSDGINFAELGRPALTASQYRDESIKNGRNWYRLQVLDRNGGTAISNVIELFGQNEIGLRFWPQPCSAQVNVRLPANTAGDFQYEILNLSGQSVQAGTFSKSGGTAHLNVANFPVGLYLMKLSNAGNQWLGKLIIE